MLNVIDKKILRGFLLIFMISTVLSCNGQNKNDNSSIPLDTTESSSTERVISGSYELMGTTEEIVDKKISGTLTIEGAVSE